MLLLILFYSGYHIVQQREIFELKPKHIQAIESESPQINDIKKEELIDKNLRLESVKKVKCNVTFLLLKVFFSCVQICSNLLYMNYLCSC